jgi:hypothetical protein
MYMIINNHLNSMKFQIILMVLIITTIDSSGQWSPLNLGSSGVMQSCSFVNDSTGYVCQN